MITKESKDQKHKRRHGLRRLFWLLTIFLFVVFLVILLIWAILQPQKPRFVIEDATIYTFNVTSTPHIFTSTFQVTITSRNPNDKIGIYYDKLDVYASYHSQQVTYYTAIPPTYQARKGINTWSPFVSGDSIPISPVNSMALSADQANGAILLLIKMDGRVRWRVGSFISGRYRFHVTCPAYMPFGEKTPNFIVGTAVKYQPYVNCKVNI